MGLCTQACCNKALRDAERDAKVAEFEAHWLATRGGAAPEHGEDEPKLVDSDRSWRLVDLTEDEWSAIVAVADQRRTVVG